MFHISMHPFLLNLLQRKSSELEGCIIGAAASFPETQVSGGEGEEDVDLFVLAAAG